MKAQFVWNPKWDESKLLAVDANARISVRGYGSGFLSAVHFPMLHNAVSLSEENELLTTFNYAPDFIPSIEFLHPLDSDKSSYVTKIPAKQIAPSVRALIELADKWTVTKPKRSRDIHSDSGWRDTMKISEWEKKDNLRLRWVIAWQWPNLNRLRIKGKGLTYENRAKLLNALFEILGWNERIDKGTLKTTANRMELYFPD